MKAVLSDSWEKKLLALGTLECAAVRPIDIWQQTSAADNTSASQERLFQQGDKGFHTSLAIFAAFQEDRLKETCL